MGEVGVGRGPAFGGRAFHCQVPNDHALAFSVLIWRCSLWEAPPFFPGFAGPFDNSAASSSSSAPRQIQQQLPRTYPIAAAKPKGIWDPVSITDLYRYAYNSFVTKLASRSSRRLRSLHTPSLFCLSELSLLQRQQTGPKLTLSFAQDPTCPAKPTDIRPCNKLRLPAVPSGVPLVAQLNHRTTHPRNQANESYASSNSRTAHHDDRQIDALSSTKRARFKSDLPPFFRSRWLYTLPHGPIPRTALTVSSPRN